MMDDNIFTKIFTSQIEFYDRYEHDKERNVDVIIPLINTNILWENNLYNFYKVIPISRLIIGDGGCTDDSINIVKKFPRVTILDHTNMKSQGGSIIDCIKHVTSKYFIYLHADVFLPDDWFDKMWNYRDRYAWYECNRRILILFEYPEQNLDVKKRALSGSQFGSREAFEKIISLVEDDYLQRNEDIILADLIKNTGYEYERIPDTFHYHQLMNKRGEKEPKIEEISIKQAMDPVWERRIFEMQLKGIIKYLNPGRKYLIWQVDHAIWKLKKGGSYNSLKLYDWIYKTNPAWISVVKGYRLRMLLRGIKKILSVAYSVLINGDCF